MERTTHPVEQGEKMNLCSFWISSRLFGVNIQDVKEIDSSIIITPTCHAPASVLGCMNIRGMIHLVVDLRLWFGFEPATITDESKVLVFKSTIGEPFGILVDKMDDFVSVATESIIDRRKDEGGVSHKEGERRSVGSTMCRGVCDIEKGLMAVINARAILPAVEYAVETEVN